MVTYRWWSKNKKISPCYSKLLERLQNDLALGENPEVNIMETQEALKRLEDHKKTCGSWDKLAKKISINKKTIMRWRKTRKINQGYRRVLYYFFKESTAEF